MDEARLVRLVVAEVLKRLREGEGLAPAPRTGGHAVRVLAPRSPEVVASLEPLLCGRFGRDVALVFNNEPDCGPDCGTGFACRLVPRLSCRDLADLALGTAHSDEARLVLDQICNGHALEVVSFEHLELEKKLPHKLFSLYEGYRKTLEGYGVGAFRARAGGTERLQGRLVTAREVEEAARVGLVRLLHGADALVTPLARDMAGELGITLVKDGDIS